MAIEQSPRAASVQARHLAKRSYLLPTILFIFLFVAALAPRALAIDAFVTIDERKWLNRSANFYYALRHGDYAATYQQGHPGVTTMWAGTAGFLYRFPEYAGRAPSLLTDQAFEEWLYQQTALAPLDLLVAGRWWIVLTATLTISCLFFPLSHLFGRLTALYATLFVAFAPFSLAHSRQLHPDSLVAGLSTLMLVTFCAWLYGQRQRRYLIGSGVAMGLALLTKSSLVLLMAAAVLLLLWQAASAARKPGEEPRTLLRGLAIWIALAGLVFTACWPAVWRNPGDILSRMLEFTYGHVTEPHSLPTYFFGPTLDSPGVFFYPVAYFFRATPATLLGLLAAFILLWRRAYPLNNPATHGTAGALLVSSLLFTAGMTVGEKKFDRYILPIVPLLDIVAACGWIGLAHLAGARWRQRREQPEHGDVPPLSARSMQFHAAILAVLVLLHGIHNVVHFPYYLTYYNPLAGGSRTAPDVLPIGWGEGLEQVAGWLNQRPNAKHLRVVSWYGDGPLSYYLQSREAVYPFYGTDHYWFDADYAVLYANQWQRLNPDPAIIDYFFSQKPVHTVTFNNLTLARVYDMRQSHPPNFTDIFRKKDATFGDKIQLAAYRLEEPAAFPGESVEITLFLKSMAAMNQDYKASLSLVAPDGALIWREERQPAGMSTRSWPVHAIWNDIHQIPVPATAEPGLYDIQLAFSELQRPLGQAIQAGANPDVPYQTAQQGTPYKVTELLVQEAQRRTPDAVWQNVRVTSLIHAPAITTGQTLLVDIAASGQQVDGSLKFSLRLVGPSNNTIAQMDKILRPNLHFELAVPDDIDPGSYALVGIVYRPETLTALPDVNGQAATVLSQVQVQAGAE